MTQIDTNQKIKEDNGSLYYKDMNSTKLNPKIKLDLKTIDESDETDNTKNESANEDEALGYAANYKLTSDKDNSFKTNKEAKNYSLLGRKYSNVSTTFSENFQELIGFTPIPNVKTDNNSHNYYGRERKYSTTVVEYFNGIERYFKEINPEKNEYKKKSHNYISKNEFFSKIMSSKSFDLAEEQNFKPNFTPKKSMDLLVDLKSYMEIDSESTNNSNFCNTNMANNISNTQKYSTPLNYNYMNMNYMNGKFDNMMPMYYYGYVKYDSKYINYNYLYFYL